jgi:hypothetical protein
MSSQSRVTHTIANTEEQGNYGARFVGPCCAVELDLVAATGGVDDALTIDLQAAGFEFHRGAPSKAVRAKLHVTAADKSTRSVVRSIGRRAPGEP